jgi:DNA polymerase III alpha subunit
MITVDADGFVRIQEHVKTYQLKQECAGISKKVLRFNKNKDRLYFISASDRSVIVEVDLGSNDFTSREKKFKYGKIIDFILNQDLVEGEELNELITLNKDGWLEIKDLNKKERQPKKRLLGSNSSVRGSVNGEAKSMKTDDEVMEEVEDVRFQIKGGRLRSSQRQRSTNSPASAISKASSPQSATSSFKSSRNPSPTRS